jgi:hypothetical protein
MRRTSLRTGGYAANCEETGRLRNASDLLQQDVQPIALTLSYRTSRVRRYGRPCDQRCHYWTWHSTRSPVWRPWSRLAGPSQNRNFDLSTKQAVESESARPSQTDLMVLGNYRAVALEAKWTESPYERVARRLLRRTKLRKRDLSAEALALDREHQEMEVRAWLEILQPLAYESLTTAGMAGVVYQMIHRAASAVVTGLSPSLVYLHFDDTETQLGASAGIYKADLTRLYQKLGRPSGFRFYVATQPIQRTTVFRTIEGLSRTLSSTCFAVCEAIKAGPLFIYGEADIEQVE